MMKSKATLRWKGDEQRQEGAPFEYMHIALYVHAVPTNWLQTSQPIIAMPSDNDDQSVSSDDDKPVAKRQKTYEADGPIEDDKSARAKLKEAGFDPNDVHTARSVQIISRQHWDNVTPMAYFASLGDLPMC